MTEKDPKTVSRAKRVLMLSPPLHQHLYGHRWRPSENTTAPFGMMYLATPLIDAGYEVKYIDLQVDKLEEKQYFQHLENSDFVLISCYTRTLKNAERIIRDTKRVNGRAYVVCGGPYCNATENHIEGSDLSVFGEPDLVIAKVLELISTNRSLAGIPGLSFKRNGRIIRNPGKLIVEDLDLLGYPSFAIAKNKHYGYFYGQKINHITAVGTSRGCPFRCSYCTTQRTKYRERSVDSVIEEIRTRVEEGAKYLIFYDDNFLLRRSRALEIAEKIIENKLKIKIGIAGRVDLNDYHLLRKLREAGVILINFGIESANQDILDFYNKKATVENVKNAIVNSNKAGILTLGNIIIGAPMENREHIDANNKFLNEAPLDFLSVHILHYTYPSALWQDAFNRGLLGEDEIEITANKKLSPFSYQELVAIQNEMIRAFYNNPKRIIRISFKLGKTFNWGYFLKLVRMFVGKGIYRPAERFHDAALVDPMFGRGS